MQKSINRKRPNLSKIPRILFWDTDFDAIDWQGKSVAVIKRIFERGDNEAKIEIVKFYGKSVVESALAKKSPKPMRLYINK